MARPSAIPENLLVPILREWEAGKNAEQIAIWLKNNHNIDVSVRSVNKRIKSIKDLEMQARRDAIKQRASEQALDYIDMMDKRIIKLNKITDKLLDQNDPEKLLLAKQLSDTQLKFIDKQMNLTGMDKPDNQSEEDEAIVEGLIAKLPMN